MTDRKGQDMSTKTKEITEENVNALVAEASASQDEYDETLDRFRSGDPDVSEEDVLEAERKAILAPLKVDRARSQLVQRREEEARRGRAKLPDRFENELIPAKAAIGDVFEQAAEALTVCVAAVEKYNATHRELYSRAVSLRAPTEPAEGEPVHIIKPNYVQWAPGKGAKPFDVADVIKAVVAEAGSDTREGLVKERGWAPSDLRHSLEAVQRFLGIADSK